MRIYLDLVKKVLAEGRLKSNRTGVKALSIVNAMLQHDLSQGFPLLTTKKMAFKSIKVELEFFIKGLTDKKWLIDRGCHIWDAWCRPDLIPQGLDEKERKAHQLKENDLGPIYGAQWRNFGGSLGKGIDQLETVVKRLKKDPNDRRLLVSAWNPLELASMALPPCHVLFHLVVLEDTLNLTWFQRSCDLMLGIPFNLASHALLLHLLALESGLTPGMVTGMLSDVHIYENHLKGAELQLARSPLSLPDVLTPDFRSIFDWHHEQTTLGGYQSHEKIALPVAI